MSFGRAIGLDDLEASSVVLGETVKAHEKNDGLNMAVLV